jgi:hypothetical protein
VHVDETTGGRRESVGPPAAHAPHSGHHRIDERNHDGTLRLVNSAEGRAVRLQGVHSRVVTNGAVRPGDEIRVL